MPAKYSFLPWLRKGIGLALNTSDDLGTNFPYPQNGNSRATVEVGFQVTGTSNPVDKTVELVGPGDIVGLDSRNILRVFPEPNVGNFESNYLPFIEFYEDTFCWDYTPAAPNANNDKRLRPWLFLVVLAEGEFELTENPSGPLDFFTLNKPPEDSHAGFFPSHEDSWAWAHVHVNVDLLQNNSQPISQGIDTLKEKLQSDPDFAVARLLCPRRLSPNTSYTAFVIPAFEAGRLAGLGVSADIIEGVDPQQPSWNTEAGHIGAAEPDKFPIYHKWSFGTGPRGDFEYLVRSLTARPLKAGVGLRELDAQEPSPYGIPGVVGDQGPSIDLGEPSNPSAIPI